MRSSIRGVRVLLLATAMMWCLGSYADGVPDPVDPGEPSAPAGSSSTSGAASVSEAAALAANDIDLNVASESVADSSSTSDARSGSSSGSGAASVINYSQPRQVPPVFLPGLMVSDCGAAGSAGASDKGGAGAFGIAWTTKRCYALRSAINFFAIGEYQTGCELLLYVNREAFKMIGKDKTPDCQLVAAGLHAESSANRDALRDPPIAITPMPARCPECATKEELDRAFKQSMKK